MIDQKSIAVLPFDNLSSDPENEYFSDGMTEEIINALSKINGLKVTARTSSFVFKSQKEDVRIIGNKLGVTTVLEGSIRKSGERVRITAQLIRTDNGFHIWSENFDRRLEDIFALQDEISLLIADRIRENFGHLEISEHLIHEETTNLEAYELYLRGKFQQLKWDASGFKRAVEYYDQSIGKDPEYPMPYLAASQTMAYLTSWNFTSREEGHKKAVSYLDKVGEQHDSLQEYQFSQLTKSLWLDWNWPAAQYYGDKLLAQFPSFAEGLEAMAELYYAVGSFDKGHELIDKALTINPLSPNHHYTKGMMYYLSNDLTNAIESFDRSIELDSKWVLAIQVKACCLILLKREEELQGLYPRIENQWEIDSFQLLFDMIHKGVQAQSMTDAPYDQGYLTWQVYLNLYSDNKENAYKNLSWGVNNHIGQYIGFANDPMLTPFKGDRDFIELVDRTIGELAIQSSGNPETLDQAKLSREEVTQYRQAIRSAMEDEKLFLNASVTLRAIAESIDLHPNKLSWLLNEKIGKNFNDFVNGYRLVEFQQKAIDPEYQHLTLLGLAYESGFTSKSVFNDFFKKQTGLTPKAWVNQAKKS